jgi:hypothetical protein
MRVSVPDGSGTTEMEAGVGVRRVIVIEQSGNEQAPITPPPYSPGVAGTAHHGELAIRPASTTAQKDTASGTGTDGAVVEDALSSSGAVNVDTGAATAQTEVDWGSDFLPHRISQLDSRFQEDEEQNERLQAEAERNRLGFEEVNRQPEPVLAESESEDENASTGETEARGPEASGSGDVEQGRYTHDDTPTAQERVSRRIQSPAIGYARIMHTNKIIEGFNRIETRLDRLEERIAANERTGRRTERQLLVAKGDLRRELRQMLETNGILVERLNWLVERWNECMERRHGEDER